MNNWFFDNRKLLYKTVSLTPFIYLSASVSTSVHYIFFALLLQIAMLFITKSYGALLILSSSCLGVLLANTTSSILKKNHRLYTVEITLVQGIIIGLLTPSTYPPVEIFIISLAVMIIVNYAFNGFADSWVNPAALAVVIAWIFNMSGFPPYQIKSDQLQLVNPSLQLIHDGTFSFMAMDSQITDFLNRTIFHLLGFSVPDGYVSLFWDTHAVIPAFRFNFITLLSSILLLATNVIDFVIPTCYLFVYSILILFGGAFLVKGMPYRGDILLALLTSGTFFCVFFLVPWYGTTPVSTYGKICYGCIGGIVAFLIVGCGTSPVGSVFTVIIINIFSLLIQMFENRFTKHRMQKLLTQNLHPEVHHD